jgi:hypothetical protein
LKITTANFLHWYDSQVDPGLPELPVAYLRDRNACGHMAIALPTEAMSFYINTPSGVTLDNFDNLRLGMYRADGTEVAPALGPLQKLDLEDGGYHIYCTLVIPLAAYGVHYFKIYYNSTGEEVYRSGYVLVRTDTQTLYDTTIYARFRHDRFYYNVEYGLLPGFYQQFRLGLSVIDEQVEEANGIEQYNEITTGKSRIYNSFEQKSVKLESYYFDRAANEAAALLFKHDFVELNGNRYRLKESYKATFNPLSKLYKGEVTVLDDTFSSVNRC